MSTMTLPHRNGSSAYSASEVWIQSSVQTFFSGFNWEDNPPEVHEVKQAAVLHSTEPLSLTLSVSQFFAAVNWDGTAIAAATPQPAAPAQKPDDLTLDDFFNLF